MQAYEMTIKELQAALREKKISASEAMQSYQRTSRGCRPSGAGLYQPKSPDG